jgi:hypothetical protein
MDDEYGDYEITYKDEDEQIATITIVDCEDKDNAIDKFYELYDGEIIDIRLNN